MAGSAIDGFGATVTFGTSTFAANIRSIEWSGRERGTIESTHMGTSGGSKTYIPQDLVEGGEVTIEVFHNGTDAYKTILAATAETVTIGWNTGVSWAASMFCTGISPAVARIGEAVTCGLTFKVAGEITEDTTP